MMDETFVRSYVIPSAIALGVAFVVAFIILMVINTTLMRIPIQSTNKPQKVKQIDPNEKEINPELKYGAIFERNLFRSKLQIELPNPKTDKEIEEENFINALRAYALKGVWMGDGKGDHFAFIDKGPQKGVWIHRNGEVMENGLILSEIRPNSILITKGDFGATLTLFTKGFERAQIKRVTDNSKKNLAGLRVNK